ncbi:hypothetical protein [Paenibacillus hexagrammi]|uniref:Uncharacterized protein n=1 Tax=Paenibacillus hexagrammi TaxID=2908839 RepID=A0ABY3SKY5_9BACL|nr:hypothetical protein [Paenibacillus sp. YPD9-1]UJF34369.1 hypothetical protein L0M14_03950 [Paenibacillus sp. YPD9-1]
MQNYQETETVSVELTVKEALALGSGVKFAQNPALSASAKKKVLQSLERKLLPETGKAIDYHFIEV